MDSPPALLPRGTRQTPQGDDTPPSSDPASPRLPLEAQDLLTFWFGAEGTEEQEIGQRNRLWFHADLEVDEAVRTRFGALYEEARHGALEVG